jgi:hypothetical protein
MRNTKRWGEWVAERGPSSLLYGEGNTSAAWSSSTTAACVFCKAARKRKRRTAGLALIGPVCCGGESVGSCPLFLYPSRYWPNIRPHGDTNHFHLVQSRPSTTETVAHTRYLWAKFMDSLPSNRPAFNFARALYICSRVRRLSHQNPSST